MTAQITPCLWFTGQAEEAANFYCSIFKGGKITDTRLYTEAGKEHHQYPVGSVMVVSFTINGTNFTALNGPPIYTPSAAISFQITCQDQAEVDHYWEKLGEGGDAKKKVCGWLEDKFQVNWQVIPKQMMDYMNVGGEEAKRVSVAMMGMTKLEVEGLKKAFEGKE